jgi:hypothetical protein
MMKWNMYGRNYTWSIGRHYPRICLEEVRKSTENLIEDGWPLG